FDDSWLMFKECNDVSHCLNLAVKRILLASVYRTPRTKGNVRRQIIQVLGINLKVLLAPICRSNRNRSRINRNEPAQLVINRSENPRVALPSIKRTGKVADTLILTRRQQTPPVTGVEHDPDPDDDAESGNEEEHVRLSVDP